MVKNSAPLQHHPLNTRKALLTDEEQWNNFCLSLAGIGIELWERELSAALHKKEMRPRLFEAKILANHQTETSAETHPVPPKTVASSTCPKDHQEDQGASITASSTRVPQPETALSALSLSRRDIRLLCLRVVPEIDYALSNAPPIDTCTLDGAEQAHAQQRSIVRQTLIQNWDLYAETYPEDALLDRMVDHFTGDDIKKMTDEEVEASVQDKGLPIDPDKTCKTFTKILHHITRRHRSPTFSMCPHCNGVPLYSPPRRHEARRYLISQEIHQLINTIAFCQMSFGISQFRLTLEQFWDRIADKERHHAEWKQRAPRWSRRIIPQSFFQTMHRLNRQQYFKIIPGLRDRRLGIRHWHDYIVFDKPSPTSRRYALLRSIIQVQEHLDAIEDPNGTAIKTTAEI